jgi:type IV secretion system protein VirB1
MATFETFALQCAASVALDLLAAIASVESGMRPLAIRDGDKVTVASSIGEGVAVVVGITDRGREPGVGLMALTPQQLRAAGMTLQDGFDPCKSLKAAAVIATMAQANAAGRGHGPLIADRLVVRSWWRTDSQFPSAAALEAAVAQERSQSATLTKKDLGPGPVQAAGSATKASPVPIAITPHRPGVTSPQAPDCWDIFARQRAGLQQCDAPDLVASASTSRSKSPAATTNATADAGR